METSTKVKKQKGSSSGGGSGEDYWLFKYIPPLRLLYLWVFPIVWKGFFKVLSLKDLPRLSTQYHAHRNVGKFRRFWDLTAKFNRFQLAVTILLVIGVEFSVAGLFQFLSLGFSTTYPFFLSKALEKMRPLLTPGISSELEKIDTVLPPEIRPPKDALGLFYREDDWMIWIWLLLMFSFQICSVLFEQFCSWLSARCALKNRSLLTTLIYEKCLRISVSCRRKHHTGKILNYIAGDMWTLEFYLQRIHYAWSSMLMITVVFIILGVLFGYSIWVSVGVALLIIAVVVAQSLGQYYLRKQYIKLGDKRIETMNEVFSGIRIIKFFAWEKYYRDKIFGTRKIQVRKLRGYFFMNLLMNLGITCAPTILQFSALFVHACFNNFELDIVLVLATHAYFNLLRAPIVFAPEIITQFMTAMISLDRIQAFFREDEIEPVKSKEAGEGNGTAVKISNGNFSYAMGGSPPGAGGGPPRGKPGGRGPPGGPPGKKAGVGKLTDINLNVKCGELVMVCGAVGSGKTSLLRALIGEIGKKSGEVEIYGSVAYCTQDPWIQNLSLIDNVLMSNPDESASNVNEEKWDEIVRVCNLGPDLEVLDGGRNIEIGEKGVNLSGGQKYRVSLARACWANSDIYLLDDPLAAVDSHVGKSIFSDCIKGYMKEKSVILVTHQLQFATKVDRIIVMDEGKIVEEGNFEQLMEQKGLFCELFENNIAKGSGKKKEKKEKKESPMMKAKPGKEIAAADVQGRTKSGVKLIKKEEREKGGIKFAVLHSYVMNSGGYLLVVIMLFLFVMSMVVSQFNDWWVSNLSSGDYFLEKFDNHYNTSYCNSTLQYSVAGACEYNDTVYENVEIFWDPNFKNKEVPVVREGITSFQALLLFIATSLIVPVFFFLRGALAFHVLLNTAERMFRAAVSRVLATPMRFFESSPMGRIMNRFTNDVRTLDIDLPLFMFITFGVSFALIFSLIFVCFSTSGIFVPVCIVLGTIYLLFFSFYRRTSREVKRVESIQLSPLFASFGESLTGVSTIRAYGMEDSFIDSNRQTLNKYNTAHFISLAGTRWMMVYLSFIGIIMTVATAVITVLTYYYADFWMNKATLGLGLAKMTMITHLFFLTAFFMIQAEVRLNAVERVDHYGKNLNIEEAMEIIYKEESSSKKENAKIKKGQIEFIDFSFRYRDGLPLVLKNLALTIVPQERIGIVGRTGSGKSSMFVALMRLVESSMGKIVLDGQYLHSDLTLKELRSIIGIIPQDPVLFSGTIRSNLDPHAHYTDAECIEVLKKSHIPNVHIDAVVDENGKNFSIGERQLICLARALLKESPILLLDECTASVDMDTDRLIQETIRKECKSTIITIAHRLSTVCDYDRIIVLNDGNLVEFDTPKNLVSKENSLFLEMLRETPNSDFLVDNILNRQKKVNTSYLARDIERNDAYKHGYKYNLFKITLGEESMDIGGNTTISFKEIDSFRRSKGDDSFRIVTENANITFKIIQKDLVDEFKDAVLNALRKSA